MMIDNTLFELIYIFLEKASLHSNKSYLLGGRFLPIFLQQTGLSLDLSWLYTTKGEFFVNQIGQAICWATC